MPSEYTYLTMTAGTRTGTSFLLDQTDRNRIGRGMDCDIVLADPLCSRVHAEVVREQDGWWLHDTGSRNGTYVDDERAGSVRLESGGRVKMGSTEFTFCCSNDPPTHVTRHVSASTESIVKQSPIQAGDSDEIRLAALRQTQNHTDLLELYQLSTSLLGCDDPNQVVRMALERLHGRTRAAVVGFLWVSDEGELRPKHVIPKKASRQVSLSQSLTDIVLRQSHAVWVANEESVGTADSLRPYADAVCVPLVHQHQTLGAIHMYLDRGRFRQADFDFAISLAYVLGLALARSRREAILTEDHRRLVASTAGFDELLGECEPLRKLKEKITRIARATGCVLIRGESGTGKELVARAVHRASVRADRPMLSVNCAAIPASLIESQLFGHAKGAFTSAQSAREGWFQQADTGTLFLDEVGELTLDGQAKLLRVLEGHPFLPVGAGQEVSVDVRVIAATNRDLRQFVREKRFREDLYYRFAVFELFVPPLRDRGGDVEMLLDHFLEHFRVRHGRPGLQLSPDARQRLLSYSWPGNVRQLRNVIDSATVMAAGDAITPQDLGLHDAGAAPLDSLRIDDWERQLIREALNRSSENVVEAAKLLGIGRATLYRKIEEYDIKR